MEITVRRASAQDYENLCQLFEEVDALHREHLPNLFRQPADPARDRDYLLDLIEIPDAELFVAEVAGQLAGFVSAMLRQSPPISLFVPRLFVVIDNLAVKREYRRAGVGRALMERAQQWSAAQAAEAIELNVYEFNQAAMAFYKSLGYQTSSRRMSKAID